MTASEMGFERLADLHELERLDLYRADIEGPALVSILRTNPKLKHLSVGKFFGRFSNLKLSFSLCFITNWNKYGSHLCSFFF